MSNDEAIPDNPDVVLVGAGIMSATLGVLLKELDPSLSIAIFERLPDVAKESSDAWNNAGTGHSAFCELNYTPADANGGVDITKALKIASSFELSKEFWAYLVAHENYIKPESFIHRVPHLSFVWGDENVKFLKTRYENLSQNPLFSELQYTEDPSLLGEWMPLIMEGRSPNGKMAATRMEIGTDVDFGALTRITLQHIDGLDGVVMRTNHDVHDLKRGKDGQWEITVVDTETHKKTHLRTPFVFIGAGGGSLPLLEKSDIPEARGFAGFPVSGQWLKCTNSQVIERHAAKVYGKASVGSPPMSVPHLDTRIINGEKALLFGPYAGFTTKFLKKGSYWDLAGSLDLHNIFPMLSAGMHNMPLTKYLIQQAMQTMEDRIAELRVYFPQAKAEDWELAVAGKRVQVIKADEKEGGVLEFGTEIVTAHDGSLAALLGASPGASTAVSIMLSVLERCFKDKIDSPEWHSKLLEMIPSYGKPLAQDGKLVGESRSRTHAILGIV